MDTNAGYEYGCPMPGPVRDVVMRPGGPDSPALWWRVGIEITHEDLLVHCGRLEVATVADEAGALRAIYSHTEAWRMGTGKKPGYKYVGRYVMEELKPEHRLALTAALRQQINALIGFRFEIDGGFMLGESVGGE